MPFANARSISVAPANKGLFMTYCIMIFLTVIPFLGILAALINCFVAIAAFRSASRVGTALEGGEPTPAMA